MSSLPAVCQHPQVLRTTIEGHSQNGYCAVPRGAEERGTPTYPFPDGRRSAANYIREECRYPPIRQNRLLGLAPSSFFTYRVM